MNNDSTPGALGSNDGLGLLPERAAWPRAAEDRVNQLLGLNRAKELECQRLREENERLNARFGQAADKALTYAESYEMAVARCVLALDYMHPEQKRAFNAAWYDKRAELRALKA